MTYTRLTLTGTYDDLGAEAERGYVEIRATAAPIADADGNVVMASRVRVPLNRDGSFSVTLPATDTTGLNVTGFQYVLRAFLGKGEAIPPLVFSLTGGNKDIADLTNESYIDPTWVSAAYGSIAAAGVAAAAIATAAAAEAVAAAAYIEGLVITDLGTSDGQIEALVEAPNSLTRAALSVLMARRTVSVSAADFTGWDTGNRTAALQAAVDSLPATGGTVIVPDDLTLTAAITSEKAGVTIVGKGGAGQGVGLAWGATRITAPAAGYAFVWGGSSASYAGPAFRNLQIVGNATAAGGINLIGQSNFLLDQVTITGFTGGNGLNLIDTFNSQYGTLRESNFTDCLVGVRNNGSNGLRVMGCMFDGNANSGAVRVGSTGFLNNYGDTPRFFGTVFQFYATAVDLVVGLNAELHGCRFEGFTTAIRNAAPSTRVYGGSFNNTILGGGGTAMNNLAAATNLLWHPGDVSSVGTRVADAGTGTQYAARAPKVKVSGDVYSSNQGAYSTVETVTATAGQSGCMLVTLSGAASITVGGAFAYFQVFNGATTVGMGGMQYPSVNQKGHSLSALFTGLTPGQNYTLSIGVKVSAGTWQARGGTFPNDERLVVAVHDASV